MNTIAHLPGFYFILLLVCVVSVLGLLLAPIQSKQFPKSFYLWFVPLFISLCFGGYGLWGGSAGLLEQDAISTLKNDMLEITKDPDIARDDAMAKFAQLEAKIAYSPNALMQMASIYTQLGLFDNALVSLDKAMLLSPKEPEFQVQWVYTHSLKNQGKLPVDVRQKAQSLFDADQTHYVLQNLLAIDDYFNGNYQDAVAKWESILISDESLTQEKQQVIQSALLKAKSLLGTAPSIETTLAVNVKLNPALFATLRGDETVFVFVKQKGERMPLAVIKKKASECPFSVDFDSKHSMIANKPLMAGMKVEVVAKLSKTGDPLDKTGELRTNSHQFTLESVNKPSEVEIN